MKTFKEKVKFIFIYHFCEKNFVLIIKRLSILTAAMLIAESASEYFNLSDFVKVLFRMIGLICLTYIIISYLIYRFKEAKEAIKEIIVMIKNL